MYFTDGAGTPAPIRSWSPSDVSATAVVEPIMVLGKEVAAVIAAVRRPHEHVNVVPVGNVVVEDDTGMVVELDQHNRGMNPVVEGVAITPRAIPREPGLLEMRPHFGEANRRMNITVPPGVL